MSVFNFAGDFVEKDGTCSSQSQRNAKTMGRS